MKPNTLNKEEHKTREEELQELIEHTEKTIHKAREINVTDAGLRYYVDSLSVSKAELKGIKQGYAKALDDVEKEVDLFYKFIEEEFDEDFSNICIALQKRIAKLKEKQ